MSKSNLFILLLAVALVAPAAFGATINVPAGQPTIQAAVTAAANGDTIIIADGTYNEEVYIPGSSLNSRNNLTLEAAAGATVIINCPNTRTASVPNAGLLGLISSALGGGGLPDHHGVIVEGSGITLRNLTIRNLSATGDALFGEAATVLLLGANCTIDNCVLECNTDNEAGRALYIFTGNYVALDGAFGGQISANGYAAPINPSNLTITDSTLRYGDATFDTVDAAYYIAILNGFIPPPFPVVHSTGTITNSEFQGSFGGGGLGEFDCGNMTFTNCLFHEFNDAADIGGGTWNFVDCLFERSSNSNMVAIESNIAEAGGPHAAVSFDGCIFCGDASDGRLVRLSEGNGTFTQCIFNITDTVQVVAGIQYSAGDYTSDWVAFGYPTSSTLNVDNCDFYSPAGRGILADDPPVSPEPTANINVTDSIFQCLDPIVLTGTNAGVARAATVTNNDLFTTGVVNNTDWTLTATSNVNVDPQYAAPQVCDPLGYQVGNASLAGLGSQGTLEAGSSVQDWSLYR